MRRVLLLLVGASLLAAPALAQFQQVVDAYHLTYVVMCPLS